MKNLTLACLIGLAAVAYSTLPASAADDPMADSKYCMESNSFDPLCMDEKTFKMREMMMSMTKEKVMAGRTKYCEENASSDDPICKKEMMESTKGY